MGYYRPRSSLALITAGVLLVGCANGASDSTDTTTSTPATATTDGSASSDGPPRTDLPTSTTVPTSSGTDDWPGERTEIYPYEGANLAVVGVDRDDVLNLRIGPGPDYSIVDTLEPTATDLTATGHNRTVEDQYWVEVVIADGDRGWVDGRFVLQLGPVDDITTDLGEPVGGETMVDIAHTVGERRASEEPPSRIVIIEDPVVADLGEIMVDVIGLGDDAAGGERLHILAEPSPSGEGFVVQSVQRITLCSRGVSQDQRCV